MENLEKIAGVSILGKTGERIMSQYNPFSRLNSTQKQDEFERALLKVLRTQFGSSKKETNFAIIDGFSAFFTTNSDFYIVVVAEEGENELLLDELLRSIDSAFLIVCGKEPTSKQIYKNYPELLLMLNESSEKARVLTPLPEEAIANSLLQDYKRPVKAGSASKVTSRGFFGFM